MPPLNSHNSRPWSSHRFFGFGLLQRAAVPRVDHSSSSSSRKRLRLLDRLRDRFPNAGGPQTQLLRSLLPQTIPLLDFVTTSRQTIPLLDFVTTGFKDLTAHHGSKVPSHRVFRISALETVVIMVLSRWHFGNLEPLPALSGWCSARGSGNGSPTEVPVESL